MGSKQAILDAIAEHRGTPVEMPDPVTFGVTYDDPLAQFSAVLEAVGGRAIHVPDVGAARETLKTIDVAVAATNSYSTIPGLIESNVELANLDDPRELNTVDIAILPGYLAVAENAAVWVDDCEIRHRVIYFIAEHLVLVVPSGSLVHNMHEAYQRLRFDKPQYGVFISGPSKTADIEQSLVIGAQGPRSLHVILVDHM